MTFDLSMSGHYGYYTGIVFRAYTYGTGDAIVTGGRMTIFWKSSESRRRRSDLPLSLMNCKTLCPDRRSLWRPGTTISSCIPMPQKNGPLHWQKDFREKGKYMELLKRTEEDSKETFIAYGKRTHAVSMLYLNENLTIDMVNLSTGEEKKVNARKKAKARENR